MSSSKTATGSSDSSNPSSPRVPPVRRAFVRSFPGSFRGLRRGRRLGLRSREAASAHFAKGARQPGRCRRGSARPSLARVLGPYTPGWRCGDPDCPSEGPKDRAVDESWPTDGVASGYYGRQKAAVERILDTFEDTGAPCAGRASPAGSNLQVAGSSRRSGGCFSDPSSPRRWYVGN